MIFYQDVILIFGNAKGVLCVVAVDVTRSVQYV